MSHSTIPPGFRPIRHDRLLQEEVHDAYKASAKLREPVYCPQCSAVYREGSWRWADIPKDAREEPCPACHRVNDHYPAGFVTLQGAFFMTHRSEIMSLVHHEAQRERLEHPLKRVMGVEDRDESALITTTDIHLARALGEAVHRAYQGELEFHYNPAENLLRVHWSR